MKVKLNEIPAQEPLLLSFSSSHPHGAFLREVAVGLSEEPLPKDFEHTLKIKLERVMSDFLVTGTLKSHVAMLCSRCLKPIPISIQKDFSTLFSKRVNPECYEEKEMVNELDMAPLVHDFIDVADAVREQIYLEVPLAPLCQEKCKGLCSQCGSDLNLGAHTCNETQTNSPFAVLKSKFAKDNLS